MAAIEFECIDGMAVHRAGSGPTLVFVHGFTTTSDFWREQPEAFSSDYQVIRINLPGHGASSSPKDRPYTIDAFVKDVLTIFDRLAIHKAVLIGLSMGGTIAQRFALAYPDRLEALVLVGATAHGLGADVDAANVHKAIDELGIIKASQRVIERSFSPVTPRQTIEFAKAEVVQTPEFVARQAITSLNESDYRSELHRIQMPTLIIVGKDDIITPPEESRVLANGIAGSSLEIIPQAGHFPMLEQPETFNRLLKNFLSHTHGRS